VQQLDYNNGNRAFLRGPSRGVILKLHEVTQETIEAMAFRIFIRIYVLFKIERLRTNIKLTLHKGLMSIMTYACPVWEFEADNHLRLQNKFLRTIGNLARRTPVRDLHVVYQLRTYMIIQQNYAGKKAEVIHNHGNANVLTTGQGEPRHSTFKMLKVGGGEAYDRSSDCCCSGSY
jgi:hypothetical protein